nr:unnamed protein product [Brassica oleracea]
MCFRFGVCVTRPVTLWETPHRSAVPVNINHSDSLSHHVCYSGPMMVKYSTRVVATPQIPRSMSSRLDLPWLRRLDLLPPPPSQLLTPHLPATPAPKTFTGCHSFDRRNLFPRP